MELGFFLAFVHFDHGYTLVVLDFRNVVLLRNLIDERFEVLHKLGIVTSYLLVQNFDLSFTFLLFDLVESNFFLSSSENLFNL